MNEIPEEYRSLVRISGKDVIIPDRLRKLVRFEHHDLLKDPPLADQDIVLCRNLLIYLPKESQEKVIDLIYRSMNKNGFLITGKSETLPKEFSERFKLYDVKNRIYRPI
jgi:chemotaxis methyl-accepting protein methylase